jgi:hypothetical protein
MEIIGDKLLKTVLMSRGALHVCKQSFQLSNYAYGSALKGIMRDDDPTDLFAELELETDATGRKGPSITAYRKGYLIEQFEELKDFQAPLNSVYLLVTSVEASMGDVLRQVFMEFPAKIQNKNKLDFENVLRVGSLEELKLNFINSVLNELSYKSPRDFGIEFSKHTGVALDKSPVYEQYVEIKATRDIFIHNDGVANHIYIAKAGVKARANEGERLPITSTYFLESYQCCLMLNELLATSLNETWPTRLYAKFFRS